MQSFIVSSMCAARATALLVATHLVREGVDERVADHRLHHLLTHIGCLPHLRELVPHVLAVDRAATCCPRADELGPQRHDPLDEERSPVVTDDVDRFTDLLDLRDHPVDVFLFRRGRSRRAPARRTPEGSARSRRRASMLACTPSQSAEVSGTP